jgi:TolC family type I secretion outer membrane protein
MAYTHAPDLRAAQAETRALDESVAVARSAWRPTITLNHDLSRQWTTTTNAKAAGTPKETTVTTPRTLTASVSQPIWNGQILPGIAAAEDRVEEGRARLLVQEQTTLQGAADAYFDVLEGEELVALRENKVSVLARQLEAMTEGQVRGINTVTELAQARASHASAVAELQRARTNLDTARSDFELATGRPPRALTFPGTLPEVPDSLDMLLEKVDETPTVWLARAAADAARAEVDMAVGALLPSVDLRASQDWTFGSSESVDETSTFTVGLSVNVPLYQSGAQWATARQRKQTLGKALSGLDGARDRARRNAVSAWNRLVAAQGNIASYEVASEASRIAYEGVEAEYGNLGTRAYLDVLLALQDLFEARNNLLQARTAEAKTRFAVLAAAGELTAAALGLPVAIYNPVPHYESARGRWFGLGE